LSEYLATSVSFLVLHVLNEIIKSGWPSTIILEVSQIATCLLIQFEKQIPIISRHYNHFTLLLLVLQELFPIIDKATFTGWNK
jgi:hypothetical protein